MIIECVSKGLGRIGLAAGDCVMVHSSFKSLGLKGHSPSDVIETIVDFLGVEGTLVMPAFSYNYSGIWDCKPFKRDSTTCLLNGILTETLRNYPGALRSGHPTHSVAAIGKHAEKITSGKENANPLGIGSSLEEICRLGGKILLLGVGNESNSMLHYAEAAAGLPYRDIPFRAFGGNCALVDINGEVLEVPLASDYPGCSLNFGVAGQYLAEKGIARHGRICEADSTLLNAAEMVEAVVKRLKNDPSWLLCSNIMCEPCTLRKRRLHSLGLIS